MVLVTTSTEVACSPEHLRKVFLDFPRIPQWTQSFIRSITPITPNKPATELTAGDKLTVQLAKMSFSPVVLENSPQQFMWRGTVPLLFYGDHFFRFEASKTTPGGSTFTHGEEFTGVLAAPFLWLEGEKTGKNYSGFNEDLKREAEKGGERES